MKFDTNYTDDRSEKSGGKGFYIALAVCLVAVCGVAVTTFVGTLDAKTPQEKTTVTAPKTTAVQQVVKPATDVKDERTTATIVSTTVTTVQKTATTTDTADLFVFPASNTVLAPYSESMQYSETLGSWNTHNGVDFAATPNAAVKAPADGTVTHVEKDGLWGDWIEIDHGGRVVSRCYGVKAKNVVVGSKVKAGDVIGTVTEIPAEITSDSHIHVEVLANNKYVDPLLLIRGTTVTVPTATHESTK